MFRSYFGLSSKLQLSLRNYILQNFPSYDLHVLSSSLLGTVLCITCNLFTIHSSCLFTIVGVLITYT